jgi:phosphoglycolate phosphatase-like HAD superfamily hydrolase
MNYQSELKNINPEQDFFIGIDSDGCVFDTMEVKQKVFFIPNGIKYFDLFPAAEIVRETWEFVNLYSYHRGTNRFPALTKVFELLEKRKEFIESGSQLPDLTALKHWINNETRLSNATLLEYSKIRPDKGIEKVLEWSQAVNKEISEWLHNIPPFPEAVRAIHKISSQADTIVVSQTPLEALEREWDEHNIRERVRVIAGQEHGTKAEHIAYAAKGKYPDEHILLIGDAPGDLDAARSDSILFYPVIPGKENLSWKRFSEEGFHKFVSGSYSGTYQDSLIEEFVGSLPSDPPWETC